MTTKNKILTATLTIIVLLFSIEANANQQLDNLIGDINQTVHEVHKWSDDNKRRNDQIKYELEAACTQGNGHACQKLDEQLDREEAALDRGLQYYRTLRSFNR
jgi:hypothetical protein